MTIPGCTTKFNPSTASVLPYRLLRFSTSIIGVCLSRHCGLIQSKQGFRCPAVVGNRASAVVVTVELAEFGRPHRAGRASAAQSWRDDYKWGKGFWPARVVPVRGGAGTTDRQTVTSLWAVELLSAVISSVMRHCLKPASPSRSMAILRGSAFSATGITNRSTPSR